MEQLGADLLGLTGGDDHAGVGNRQADAGGDVGEGLVVDAVVELVGVNVRGPLQAGDADGVGADTVDGLQMLGVHDEARELVLVQLQAEEDAQTHVVDTALHGAVHGLGVVVVVVLGTRGVKLEIALLVVGLLEKNISTDARILELAVVLYCRSRDVYVDTADSTVLVLDAVDGVNALENILDRIVHGVLARLDRETLVSHILKRDNLCLDLLLRELLTRDVLVLHMVRTVDASVYAVVREIEGREHNYSVAVHSRHLHRKSR